MHLNSAQSRSAWTEQVRKPLEAAQGPLGEGQQQATPQLLGGHGLPRAALSTSTHQAAMQAIKKSFYAGGRPAAVCGEEIRRPRVGDRGERCARAQQQKLQRQVRARPSRVLRCAGASEHCFGPPGGHLK